MEVEMEKGVQRWIVNISEWEPSPLDFSNAISLLPHQQHSSITRFVKIEDRKTALMSRLLQYALVHLIIGIPFDEIVINRTNEGIPYLEAFVKALGTGVGYKLDYVEFHHKDWTDIYVKVNGDVLKDWKFCLFELHGRHQIAVARGHPGIATKNYKDMLKQTHFDNELYKLGFNLPNPMFITRTVKEPCTLFHTKELNRHIHP